MMEGVVSYRFQQVDVFAEQAIAGNPVAVVLGAEELTTEQMQAFTRWMNLSETTFVLPPTTSDADYRVRIFTLARELPFAGHPTLGTCHAWLAAGGTPRDADRIVQECGAGLVPIRRDGGRLAFAAPPLLRSGPVEDDLLSEIAARLGVDRAEIVASNWVDNGPGWVAVMLPDAQRVLDLTPDTSRFDGEGSFDIGVIGAYPAGSEVAFEVRAFFSDATGAWFEDPVTGSLNASLAQWLLGSGLATAPYVASQGTSLGRTGRVHIEQDDEGTIWVAGATSTVVAGTADLGPPR